MARRAVAHWSAEENVTLDRGEVDFVIEQAGGHPGLLRTATRLVVRVASGAPIGSRTQALALARERLESDSVIRSECAKLWGRLSPLEQEALLNFLSNDGELPGGLIQADLVAKGLMVFGYDAARISRGLMRAMPIDSGERDRQPRPVCTSTWMRARSGWTVGVPTLTDLEYRLLLLLCVS